MKNGWKWIKKMDEIWMNNGWQWMKLGKHWCRKEKRMKNGWKLDGNGNIEHAWNDFIRIDEQGLNRIKLDGEKQWIMNGKWIEIMDIYIYIYIYNYLYNIMNTLQPCCAGPKHRMTIWKPLRYPVKQWAFQGSVDRCNWVEVENYWIINGGKHNKSKNWWTPMMKHEKWMEMDKKNGWNMDE